MGQDDPSPDTTPHPPSRLVYLAFFLSGAAGLMHQVVWSKLLAGLIGNTAHAQAAVLAVFMGGLALGAATFGRRVDRLGHPVQTYVRLEIVIGVYGLLMPLLFLAAGRAYLVLVGPLFGFAPLQLLLRSALAVAVVLLPAVMMGATLPVLARHLIGAADETRRQVARLYAVNSMGAVAGAGAAGFVILPNLGLGYSLAAASGLNLVAGLALWPWRETATRSPRRTPSHDGAATKAAARGAPARATPARTVPAHAAPAWTAASRGTAAPAGHPQAYSVSLMALGLSGFAAMGYEVLFVRVFAQSSGLSVQSFTIMLMAFITGISLGSWLASRIGVKRPLWLLGIMQLAVVAGLLAVTPLVSRLPWFTGLLRVEAHGTALGFELFQLGQAILCLAILLPATTCLGFAFPLVAHVQARRSGRLGAHIGSTYAWNTIGNVLGAACTTLLLVPALGTLGAFHVCFGLNLIAGLGFLAVAGETSPARRLGPLAGAATVAAIYASVGTAWLDPVVLGCGHLRLRQRPAPGEAIDPTSSFAAWRDHYVVRPEASSAFFVTEDAHATVVVQGDPRQITLFVNGKPDASTGRDLPAQAFLAHLPLMLHPGARSLLVIGYGSGITVGSALRHPIEEVDVVEISRGVLEADALFAEANGAALRDPRVRVHLDDGQSFLRAAPRRYDLIISEPSNPWIAGISGLFTVEFFRAMRDRLNPGGVATIWFHEYEQERASVELVLRSVASVFPRVEVFRTHDYLDMILLASVDPMAPDFAAMEDRFDRPAVRDDLARIRITTLAGLLMHHTLPSARLAAAVPEGPVNSVWRDRLEHAAPRSFFEGVRSNFLTDFDALWQRRELEPDLLLARYRAHRQAAGAPLSREELLEAARSATGLGAPAHVAEALHALAEVAPPRPSEPARPARGGVADPATMGLFEAGYWAERLQAEGRQDEAAPFAERLRRLIEERAARDPRGFPGAGAP